VYLPLCQSRLDHRVQPLLRIGDDFAHAVSSSRRFESRIGSRRRTKRPLLLGHHSAEGRSAES
jgi:hypothetical protein